eukprot:6053526-Amphidinium_carterae.1
MGRSARQAPSGAHQGHSRRLSAPKRTEAAAEVLLPIFPPRQGLMQAGGQLHCLYCPTVPDRGVSHPSPRRKVSRVGVAWHSNQG